jgi:pyruvate ferredoxin oxidoreductase gamma subunit
MIEVRWHARAGQGAKTASQLLALAEMREGRFVQAFPEYGPERGGAPIRAYTRIDERPIRRRYPIIHPDVVVAIEPSLLAEVDVGEGLEPGGMLIVNSSAPPTGLSWDGATLLVDAASIAGPRYVNVVMLGALAAALGHPALDEITGAARKLFAAKVGAETTAGIEAAIADGHSSIAAVEAGR